MRKNIKLLITLLLIFLPQATMAAPVTYDQYREKRIFNGKPAAPNLSSHEDAGTYRTVLKEQSKKGPNFAGHYTIVVIGCGSSCAKISVVDAMNGHVFFPQNVQQVYWSSWWHEPFGPKFQQNSRLLIVYGQVNSEDNPYGISYYEWKGSDFELIRFESRDRGRPPE